MGKEMSKILPGLYVGRLDNAHNDNDMMANCITHVLSVHEPVKQKLIKSNSYKYFEVNVKDDDTAPISRYFSKTNDFIHEARVSNGNVLIHCLAGVSRAPTVVLAYLMTVYDLSFQDAYNCLKCIRPNIMPNSGFIRQLSEFDEKDKATEKERLFKLFGIWRDIEDDTKIIKERICQYQEKDSYHLNESTESGPSDPGGSPLLLSYGSDGFFGHNPPLLSEDPLDFELDNEVGRLGLMRLDPAESDDDDRDVPGSIPIAGSVQKDPTPILGISNTDFRGRAHSRQSNAVVVEDNFVSISRYGSTAPPSMPLYFEQGDQ